MDIQQSKNINTGNLDTQGGNIHLGDNFYKSLEYKELTERIEEMRDFMQNTTDEVKRLKYSQKLNELQNQLEAFKRDIIQLAETFQKIDIDTERLRLAKQHFDNGEYKAARAVLDAEQMTGELDALLAEKERLSGKTTQNAAHLEDKANEFLILANLTAVNFSSPDRFEAAKDYFEKSLTACENPHNLGDYAHFLSIHNLHLLAIKYYEKVIKICRNLMKNGESNYKHDIARMLNNIGIIHTENNVPTKAELALKESIEIYRELEKQNPYEYTLKIANLLNNIGNFYSKWNRISEAEKAYVESIEIGEMLFNVDAEKRSSFVATLGNLGTLYVQKNDYDKARQFYDKALEINRVFSDEEAPIFLPKLMLILNQSASLYDEVDNLKKAEEHYKEALQIADIFVGMNYEEYLPYYAMINGNLAHNYRKQKRVIDTKKLYEETIMMYKDLSEINSQIYSPALAGMIIGFSRFFMEVKNSREMSIKLAEEAFDILIPFIGSPDADKYFTHVFHVLKEWNIEPETYIKQRVELE